MMCLYVPKHTRLVPLFLGVIAFTASAQTEISPICFDAMHVATYASQEKAKTAIDLFKEKGCAKSLEVTFSATLGVPPKGVASTSALLALVYQSNKLRSEIVEKQALPSVAPLGLPTTATASAASGGRLSLDFPMVLPPDLERQLSGGTASFRPSNRLQNQLIEELRGSGAAAIRQP